MRLPIDINKGVKFCPLFSETLKNVVALGLGALRAHRARVVGL